MAPSELERLIGAVLVPEVRVPGTYGDHPGSTPSDEYLRRFPPAAVIAFGRTPAGPVSPRPALDDLRARMAALGHEPPIVACDLEQGAGLHFPEGTLLPPALALAAAAKGANEKDQDEIEDLLDATELSPRDRLDVWIDSFRTRRAEEIDDLLEGGGLDDNEGADLVRKAGYVTASEARELGVELVLAPVADVNTRRDNPIIAVRSFGEDPFDAAVLARAFAAGLAAGGAGACAKHFPGHGDTEQDSHLVLPRVSVPREELELRELLPFRALVAGGVDAVMVAHLDVPALTGRDGLPTSLSREVVTGLLRGELGFDGAILTDALDMGALDSFGGSRFVLALRAGCDGLLALENTLGAAEELVRAVEHGELELERLRDAARRMRALRAKLRDRPARTSDREGNRELATHLAERALCAWRKEELWEGRAAFAVRPAFQDLPQPQAFAGLWREPHGTPEGIVLVVSADVRAGAGRYGLAPERRAELDCVLRGHLAAGRRVVLAWFASPQTLPEEWFMDPRILSLFAFAPTEPMARAAAAFLRGEVRARGSLPALPG